MRHLRRTLAALAVAASAFLSARMAFGQAPPLPPPPPPPPSASSAGPPAAAAREVRFESDVPGVTLYRETGLVPVVGIVGFHHGWWFERGLAPAMSPLCTSPCTTALPAGTYTLALGKDGGPPVPSVAPVTIAGPSNVQGHYIDRSGTRAAGAAIGIGGSLTGIILSIAAVHGETVCDALGYCGTREVVDAPLMAAGIGTILGSVIVGAALGSQHDETHFTVEPLTLSPVSTERPLPAGTHAIEAVPQGASLTVRF
jgi:hypothetical protein